MYRIQSFTPGERPRGQGKKHPWNRKKPNNQPRSKRGPICLRAPQLREHVCVCVSVLWVQRRKGKEIKHGMAFYMHINRDTEAKSKAWDNVISAANWRSGETKPEEKQSHDADKASQCRGEMYFWEEYKSFNRPYESATLPLLCAKRTQWDDPSSTSEYRVMACLCKITIFKDKPLQYVRHIPDKLHATVLW